MRENDLRTLSGPAQEALRVRAVKAVLGGMKKAEAARVFGASRQALHTWVKAHAKGGETALKAKARGRPKGRGKLLPWQAAQAAKAVVHSHPEQLDLPGFLWTRDAVRELLEKRFGVRYSARHVGRFLKRWGFTPQKPAKRAYERNPEEVRRWLEEEYPAIRELAKREGAEIHWEDESGVRSDAAVGTTWGKRGKTPIVPVSGRRFGCNMISTLTNRGKLHFMVFEGRFNSGVFVNFLDRLVRQSPKKVFVIADGHPAHKAKKVKTFVARNSDRIRLYRLPSYSPELNPDEYLNNDVKIHVTQRKRARDKDEMKANLRAHLRKRQAQPQVVRNFFRHPAVQYAA